MIVASGFVVGIVALFLWWPFQASSDNEGHKQMLTRDPAKQSHGDFVTAAVSNDDDGASVSENAERDTSRSPLESRAVIRVQVLNGCGRKGLAKWLAPALRAKGFDVRETSNADRFDYPASLVYDRTGTLRNGLRLADSLGIEPGRVKTEMSRHLADIDVTLIVGADYRNLSLGIPATTEEGED